MHMNGVNHSTIESCSPMPVNLLILASCLFGNTYAYSVGEVASATAYISEWNQFSHREAAMNDQDNSPPPPASYDIGALLHYAGPSLRQTESLSDTCEIADIRDTKENERIIDNLLSSQGISFNIERPSSMGWPGIRNRLIVSIPNSRCREVQKLFAAAVEASALDMVEGNKGFSAY